MSLPSALIHQRDPVPQPAKVNEVKLESVSEVLGENWLDGPLELLGDWVFAHAFKACSAKIPDMLLGDVPILLLAESPRPLLTHVACEMMPLIDSIEDFLPRKNYAAWLKQLA